MRSRGPGRLNQLPVRTAPVKFSKLHLWFKFEAAGNKSRIDPTIISNSKQHSEPHLKISVVKLNNVLSKVGYHFIKPTFASTTSCSLSLWFKANRDELWLVLTGRDDREKNQGQKKWCRNLVEHLWFRGGTADSEGRHRLRDEAKACQLTNNKLFYRHLSPLGFENLVTAVNRNHTLNSFRSQQ